MILSHGKTEYIDNKKKLIRYQFFSDETLRRPATRSSASTCR